MHRTATPLAVMLSAALAAPVVAYEVEPVYPAPQRVAFAAPQGADLPQPADACTLPQQVDLEALLGIDPRLLTGPQPQDANAVACAAE